MQVSTIVFAAGALAAAALGAPRVAARSADTVLMEEITVTGTYIARPSQLDSPSPLLVVGREALAASGANEIGEAVEDLTIDTGSQNNPDAFTQNFTTGTSNANLRGLGVSSTLVLVNGRRQTPSAVATDRGENFVDTSSLPPLIAFDRIEILKDGASALYGSDAVAGVVNFITRSRFEGLELALGLQDAGGGLQQDARISALYGIGGDRAHVLIAFDHLWRSAMSTHERRLSTRADDLSQAGNPGSFLVPAAPGNPAFRSAWTDAFDGNSNGIADFVEPALGLPRVSGAQPPVLADQDCAEIAAHDPQVVPRTVDIVPSPAGPIPIGLCAFDFGGFWSLVPEERRTSAYVELDREITPRLDAHLEIHAAANEARRDNSPSLPFAALPAVPADHPDNPYGTDVRFIGRLIGSGGTAVESAHDSDTVRVATSLTGTAGDAWQWEWSAQLSENAFFATAPDVLEDRFELAILGLGGPECDAARGMPGAGGCSYYNPFGTALTGAGTPNSAALLKDLVGFESVDARSRLLTVEGLASRPLGELGGGAAGLAFGAQYRADEIEHDYDEDANRDNFLFLTGNSDFRGERHVDALFAELALPLTATLDLQLAGRLEDYGDIRSADPKLTALWRPTPAVSLRASWGSAFRAPSLFQSFGTQTTLAELIDPGVGTPQFFPVRTQPRSAYEPLMPERAVVRNLGVSFSADEKIELGVDFWSFDYADVIIEQNAQAVLNAAASGHAAAAEQVVRDPDSGLLLRVDSRYDNASTLATDGLDLSLLYEADLGSGAALRIGADATYIARFDLEDPQIGRVDGAGRRNFGNFATSTPQWRANGFVSWRNDSRGADLFLRYIGAYVDDEIAFGQGPESFRRIGDHFTVDARYSFGVGARDSLGISIGAINLGDRDPPHVATNGGYDSKVHDPRGRLLYARAQLRF